MNAGTSSIEALLASATARTETVPLCLRGDLAHQHDQLVDELERAIADKAVDVELERLASEVQAVEAEIRSATADFVVRGIGRQAWKELIDEHAPTEEQMKAFGFGLRWDPETFPFVAIAASCVEPDDVTPDSIRQLEEATTEAEWNALWTAALTVNLEGRRPGESSAASAILRRLRPSSEPQEPTAPPAVSSSDAA